jgi:hypothetical protein
MNDRPAHCGAALFGWSEVAEDDRSDFVEFHNREHLPERYGVPGFLRAGRYVAVNAGTAFLTMYDIDEVATLTSGAYIERLNNPTPWTLRSLPKIRAGRRAVVRIDYRQGEARGGYILCAEWTGLTQEAQEAALRRGLPALAECDGIVSVRAGPIDLDASNIETAESRASNRSAPARGYLAVIDGVSVEALASVQDRLATDAALSGHLNAAIYQLEVSLG